MNNTNIFTIQLHDSQEDKTTCSVTTADEEHLRKNLYSTLTELKKVKLYVFKEKLNLYNEKCRIKDDVILALRTCLETYKNTNVNNIDLIALLKSKLSERKENCIAIRKTFENQLSEYENSNQEKDEQIAKQAVMIKDQDTYILKLKEEVKKNAEQLAEKTDLSVNYEKQIIALQEIIKEKDLKISDCIASNKENEIQIAKLRDEVATSVEKVKLSQDLDKNWKAKLEAEQRSSAERIKKLNDRLLQYSIREVQESLSKEDSNDIKEMNLPRIGSLKVVVQKCNSEPAWIVIQRRTDKTFDFNQGWFSFVDGFGDLDGDFWLGLENIYALTKRQQHELYVHLVFPNNETRYAHYDNFSISGKNNDYKLKSLGNYFGNAGDGLRTHEHNIFKTTRYDVKTGIQYNRWWHHDNPTCNLNGDFSHNSEFGVWWCRRKDTYTFVESALMLIRPKSI